MSETVLLVLLILGGFVYLFWWIAWAIAHNSCMRKMMEFSHLKPPPIPELPKMPDLEKIFKGVDNNRSSHKRREGMH